MEHAPLRPVPSRRSGPVEPAAATREVAAALPDLPEPEARALALVALAERPRAEVAGTLGIEETDLSALLARARKELRRSVAVLGGSGWCERAEELISDRLDGALATADAGRLDVHLRNCPRCVEHERRLVQATDWLVGGVPGAAPPVPMDPRLAEAPSEVESPETAPTETEPPAEPGPPGVPGTEAITDGAPPPSPAETESLTDAAPPPDAGPAPTPERVAAAAEVLVAARTRRQIAAAIVWNAAIALAVLLTLATIALTIAGILGAEL